ncbi:ubiquitin carboxyl-terminal hydrolase 47 [Orussus abietinus]|uniref:ubiquitin carboxyl-terminal hydrolase 47 n=1 Tax=Orussus abietinus TaxID=222816 RepID=UPI000626439B|nr:ubiquitin carboxyl-terminal hydrolase 47 [Orussus abietinus]XP_012279278.1 ubiquitin carboxyl-terminal hydrolase 47 [Orussus abietinus]XP_012279279.1 ubiquitin carboxyl-terminal hydrolase 47 [Orussus abietinus]XP_012279280.1 ubiquitin carboxyl-terminal hydrolase 47 [Orussus abietinus]
MVCMASESSVPCIITDLSNKAKKKIEKIKKEIMLYPSMKVADIFQHVVMQYSYLPDDFFLIMRGTEKGPVELDEVKDKTLQDIGVDFSGNTSYGMFIMDVLGTALPTSRPAVTGPEAEDDLMLGTSASPTSLHQTHYDCPLADVDTMDESGDFKFLQRSVSKRETNYVGLVNQAMTCYLNSLLQTLYMTPEFRNALYNWEYVESSEKDEAKSMPYQMQKLFLNLQTSTKSAIETTSLTKSFGWDSTEAWQQHDIQELCRVMFDALEQKFKNTEQADLINRLYEGKMIDYVKCLECGTEKSREDTFLDIPLPLRPFGSSVAYNSVEEALRAFVQPETLDGNNQYFCEKCNKKCDAHKGLKFTKFPYLLTLHLKRFDFDYNTFHRIKLNDKVTFPDILNLNSFITSSTSLESPGGDEDMGLGVKCDDSSTTDSGTLDDECPPCENSMSNGNHSIGHDQDDDEGIDMSNGGPSTSTCTTHSYESEKNRGNRSGGQGPYNYELFSIMIHSGSASGGHYYAYIKDFKTQEWLCFNDQSVTWITHDDIQKTYGGGPVRAYYSGAYSSSTNAYMLMYRQIDQCRNALPMQAKDFPKHIQELLKKMKDNEEYDRRNREKHTTMYKMNVYCRHPRDGKMVDVKFHVWTHTWAAATEKAYKKLDLEDVVSLDRCRLVAYNHANDLIECSLDGMEDFMVDEICGNHFRSEYLLEIRKKDEKFEKYTLGGVATKVFVVDVAKKEVVDEAISVRGFFLQTVREYKEQVGKVVNMDPKQMKMVLLRCSSYQAVLIDKDDNTLEDEHIQNRDKVFVATAFDVDPTKPFLESTLHNIAINFNYVISVHVVLPDTSEETLKDLNIPPLETNEEEERDKEKEPDNENEKKKDKEPESEVLANCGPTKITITVPPSAIVKATLPTKDAKSAEETVPRNPSPQPVDNEEWREWMGPEQSNSEDSSLSDSDRTLVGDAPDTENPHTMALTPETIFYSPEASQPEVFYFKAIPYTDNGQKLLRVLVDKRMQLNTLKKCLEPFVGVSSKYFKVYFQSNEYDGWECDHFNSCIAFCEDAERILLKLGKPLRNGDFKVDIYQLFVDRLEPFKFLYEWIGSKETTGAQAKKEILADLKKQFNIDIPYERCRLRKKKNKTMSQVFLADQKLEDLMNLTYPPSDLVVQELPDVDTVTSPEQIVMFVRRWSYWKTQLGPYQEIVLEEKSIESLKEAMSAITDIPPQYLEIAKAKRSLPCIIATRKIHEALPWYLQSTVKKLWLMHLENGYVLFYRDSREEPKPISVDDLTEIGNKEGSSCLTLSSLSGYSPRREKALKIHLDTK